jgi:hypothetical protein
MMEPLRWKNDVEEEVSYQEDARGP